MYLEFWYKYLVFTGFLTFSALQICFLLPRLLVRRVTSLTFDPEENHVILASKSGDVYQYPRDVPESSAESGAQDTGKQETEVMEADDDEEIQDGGKLLLGHISMVLDLVSKVYCI